MAAVMNVNPTRMELNKLKRRLTTAQRGHKLLKDKRDEMMRQYMGLIRRNHALRTEVEHELAQAYAGFVMARSELSEVEINEALAFPTRSFTLKAARRNIMSVNVPSLSYEEAEIEGVSPYPYSFVNTSDSLDRAIAAYGAVMARLVELAEVEKTCKLMADEIERTRRRVNALEYVMIPRITETIRSITMKLDESDRSSRSRLMKVKEMMMQ